MDKKEQKKRIVRINFKDTENFKPNLEWFEQAISDKLYSEDLGMVERSNIIKECGLEVLEE